GLRKGTGRAPRRNQLVAARGQTMGKLDDSPFVGHTQQGSWHKRQSPLLSLRRRAGLAPQGKGRTTRPFFLLRRFCRGRFNDAAMSSRHSKQERTMRITGKVKW